MTNQLRRSRTSEEQLRHGNAGVPGLGSDSLNLFPSTWRIPAVITDRKILILNVMLNIKRKLRKLTRKELVPEVSSRPNISSGLQAH